MLHLYIGDGKGKTTAAMGLALRAAGTGYAVVVGQFLKNGSSGEIKALSAMDQVEVLSYAGVVKFTFQMTEEELTREKERYPLYLRSLVSMAVQKRAKVVVLDEIIDAINAQLLELDQVLAALEDLEDCDVVMTGRNPEDLLVEKADYVTEMKKIKHPYDKGIVARKGIEY